jgi:hypothetical protein
MLKWCVAIGVGVCVSGGALAADLPAMPTKAVVQTVDKTWTWTFNSEVRYFTWSGTRGFPTDVPPLSGNGHGTQVYNPIALQVSGNPNPDWKIDSTLRGGFVWASQTTSGNRGSVSTPVDTQLSGTATYLGINGVQPFATINFNLPTGSSALYGNSRFARMDPDLVDLQTYGEGLNVGPTLGVNVPVTPELIVTLSAGYTERGTFDKEAADLITGEITATDRIKNGNEATVTGAVGYTHGALAVQGSVSQAWDSTSSVNGFVQYRTGPRTTFSGSIGYAWNPQWSSSVNGYWVHTDRNDVLGMAPGVLIPEMFNSNTDIVRINVDSTYKMQSGLAVGPYASFLHRNHNSWDSTAFAFVPAKTRWSIGGIAAYPLQSNLSINARVEHIWTREDQHPDAPGFPGSGLPDMSGESWLVLGGLTLRY